MSNPARILAIETAGEACSVALFENGALRAHDHRAMFHPPAGLRAIVSSARASRMRAAGLRPQRQERQLHVHATLF